MKRIIVLLILFFMLMPLDVLAKEKVKLSSCVDGDTTKFILNNKEITVRYLAINTPEMGKNEESYGYEASEYTCNKLKKAKKIELEYDKNSDKKDKYDRHLAWVFYDGKLLNDELVKNGLAEIKYVYGDYKYLDKLNKSEEYAKKYKKGIYSDVNNSKYIKDKSLYERIQIKLKRFINKLKSNISDFFNDVLNEII